MMQILAQPAYKNRSFNPYNWLLYTQMQQLGVYAQEFSLTQVLKKKHKIWHLHWPDLFLKSNNLLQAILKTQALLFLMDLARLRGIKIVWTVHNLASHEQFYPRLESHFWSAFTRRLDGYISFSRMGLTTAQECYPVLKQRPGFIIPHGHYREEYPTTIGRAEALAQLEIPANAKVVLYFGRIRPYKNVPQLVQVFQQLQDKEAHLLVAGMPDETVAAELAELQHRQDCRITYHLHFIPEEKTQLYFQAADLVVLPYREILNSGGALLSLSCNRPVLVPLKGALGELQTLVGEDWVQTYEGELTVTHLQTALDWAQKTTRPSQAPLETFNWQIIASQTIAAYREIVNGSIDPVAIPS